MCSPPCVHFYAWHVKHLELDKQSRMSLPENKRETCKPSVIMLCQAGQTFLSLWFVLFKDTLARNQPLGWYFWTPHLIHGGKKATWWNYVKEYQKVGPQSCHSTVVTVTTIQPSREKTNSKCHETKHKLLFSPHFDWGEFIFRINSRSSHSRL